MNRKLFYLLSAVFISVSTHGAVRVVTSTTDLGWAVKEIGGDKVDVRALLRGTENPHFVDAIPEFIRQAAEAQLAVVVGLDLEIGWMPKVLARSGNARVQPGGDGYIETGKGVAVLEKPVGEVNRSMGDIHPAGNPHFWLSPTVYAQAVRPVVDALIRTDPANAEEYRKRYELFSQNMDKLKARSELRLKPLVAHIKGPVIIEYHREFAYFLSAYGISSLGSIEEKPGVSPSAGRLAEVALSAKAHGVKLVLAAETAPKKTLEKFREISGLPVVVVPMSLKAGENQSYTSFHEAMVEAVAQGLGGPKG